jgi:hypothetical protein
MSERGTQLRDTVDGQINGLINVLSARGEASLSLPCRGREKLGDGTVAALASHTADSYLRVAGFLQTVIQVPVAVRGDRIPPLPGSGHDTGTHDGDYTAERADLDDLLGRLSGARDALSPLAGLNDEQLDTPPPAGSFRFCDGQRTLEQVVGSLLNHQGHQIDAVMAAVT